MQAVLRWVLAVVIAWSGPVPSHASDVMGEDGRAAVERYLRAELTATRVPAASWAMLSGEEVTTGAFGRVRPGGPRVTSGTPFVIGSLTKSMTALAALRLAGSGDLDLDARVTAYLPCYRPGGGAGGATVLDLIQHTSGLSWRTGLQALDSDAADAAAFHRRIAALEDVDTNAPGRFEYSNVNYVLLGAVLEAATGDMIEDVLARTVFDPLGMTATTARVAVDPDVRPVTGHRYWFGHPVPADDLPFGRDNVPSFLVVSTAADMGVYLRAHMTGRVDGQPLVAPRLAPLLHRRGADTGRGQIYAAGWFVTRERHGLLLDHYGSYAGYHADARLALPAAGPGTGLVLLANAESYVGTTRRWAIADGAFAVMAGRAPAPQPAVDAATAALAASTAVTVAVVVGGVVTLVRAPARSRGAGRRPVHRVLIGCLALAAGPAFLVTVPLAFDATWTAISFTSPDAALVLVVTAAAAMAWGSLHVAFGVLGLRRRPSPDRRPA